MVERILPLEEEPEEEVDLVGVPDETETLIGEASDEVVASQREMERLKQVRDYLAKQSPSRVIEGTAEGVSKLLPEPEEEDDDLSDMFEVPKQGIEKEDLSDIFEVSDEDIMGEDEGEESIEDLFEAGEEKEEPEETPHWSDEDIKRYEQAQRQQTKKPLYRRTAKRYTPPQIGGLE